MAHYDSKFRSHHQLCLSILKRFGFGQNVMESRILMEVEEMINKVQGEQGRPFDMEHLTTSCVSNVLMNMLFGRRFDHSDTVFQQLLSDTHEAAASLSMVVEIFPVLRFLPYFKTNVDKYIRCLRNIMSFSKTYAATCIEVSFSLVSCSLHHNSVIYS